MMGIVNFVLRVALAPIGGDDASFKGPANLWIRRSTSSLFFTPWFVG